MSVELYCTVILCKFEGVCQNNIGPLPLESSGSCSEPLVSELDVFTVVRLIYVLAGEYQVLVLSFY